jgi:dCMP deaminase
MIPEYDCDDMHAAYEAEDRMRLAKWDNRFMDMARMVAGWSKDPSTKVGAVIVSPDRRHFFWGYNGFPTGVEDDPELLKDREEKYPRILHAETNALLMADQPIIGWTIYCTLAPCSSCAAQIIQKGITRIVLPGSPGSEHDHWGDSMKIARSMLAQAGVKLEALGHAV